MEFLTPTTLPNGVVSQASTRVSAANPAPVISGTAYASPDGRKVNVASSMGVLFSDDFGGAAIDTTRWDVIPGGLAAVVSGTPVTQLAGNPTPSFSQGAIGTGTDTGMTYSVGSSALTINLGTVNNDELWFLSRQVFAGAEDVTLILSRSQGLTANSFFVGLVEVDATTGIPLLNPNLAADFTNRGGVEFGKTNGSTSAAVEAVADSSSAFATTGATSGFSPAGMTSTFETLIEFHAEDIIASTCTVDTAAGRQPPLRISSQCPNDGKAYKLLIRARNVSAPGSSTAVVIQRVLVVDKQELRVSVDSSGSVSPQQGVPVNAQSQGVAAFGSVVSGVSPLSIGVQGRSDAGSAVATGRNAFAVADLAGRVVNQPLGNPGTHSFSRIQALATTTETTLVSAIASARTILHTLTIANHDTAPVKVDLRDQQSYTIRATYTVGAGLTQHIDFPAGLPQNTQNTTWTVQLRSATTTNGIDISASSYATAS